ncbi:hypothetical protein BJX70DRAFT_167593 [Aspergillus crustosus]
MPSSRTPLRAPSGRNARSQFASTPRFLLSQRAVARRVETDKIDSILSEDGAERVDFQTSRSASTAPRALAPRRKDVIEDPSSELDHGDESHQQPDNGNGTGSDDIPSSPPPAMADMEAEIEALFGPARHPSKRRRVSLNQSTPVLQKRKQHDFIQTSSPDHPPFPSTADLDLDLDPESNTEMGPPSPSLPLRTTPQKTPRPSTPATTRPSSTRTHPRFLISSTARPPPKPTFVLPRSPSPDPTDDPNAIPTPFSPSSRALRRRGRQRSSAPGYIPGGIASEVRSWILEMGTKREQQMHVAATLERRGEAEVETGVVNAPKYEFTLRIRDIRQTALGSCGALAFIRGHDIGPSEDGDSADDQGSRHVLLLGPPRARQGKLRTTSNRVPDLHAGDVIGVFQGLVWEVGVGAESDGSGSPVPDHEEILRRESEQSSDLRRWFVGMEWEVISSA